MVDANTLANPPKPPRFLQTPAVLVPSPPACSGVGRSARPNGEVRSSRNLEALMSDVVGARVGSDDPEQIAELRKSVPKVIAIGAQPTATPKQAPRAGAVYDERGLSRGP
jgi:hypothetical protein